MAECGAVSPGDKSGRHPTPGHASPDPPEPLRVLLPAPHIDVGAAPDRLPRRLIDLAHGARGHAEDQRIVGKLLAFGHHRAGPEQAISSDPGAVEYDRAHADEAVCSDLAAVQDHVVADHAILAYGEG